MNKKIVDHILSKERCMYVLFSLLIMAVWITYEMPLVNVFNAYILPILAIFKRNAWNILFLVGILCYCVYDLVSRKRTRFAYNPQLIFWIFWSVVICGYYRVTQAYVYEMLLWKIAYVDVFALIGMSYIISALVHKVKASKADKIVNVREPSEQNILLDIPIETLDEDELDWNDEVEKIKELIQIPVDKHSLSIAINAPWGSGKTSFLNIIKNAISKDEFEVVYFNPRDSKSVNEIQEDYFQLITTVLSKYDGRAKYLMRRYMAALQLIDDSSWLYKLLSVYNEWLKNDYRKEIANVCKRLPKKILVIIDDFDRLRPEEIQEILKLLDSNASFANFVYLTAYDKTVVGKILVQYEHSNIANFTDKYFELEYDLPMRPYGYIREYFVAQLSRSLNLDEGSKRMIKNIMVEKEDLFKNLLPTIRDVKRLINLMAVDYLLVREEVYLSEYFYVHLIKYKYPDEYKALSLKKYIEGNVLRNIDGLFLTKEVAESKDIKCLPLLNLLFAYEGVYNGNLYRHIYQEQSFENYFINKLYGSLTIHEMRKIFDVDYTEMQSMVDIWLKDEQQAKDFSNYLQFLNMKGFDSKDMFMKYATTAAYFATRSKGNHGSSVLSRLLYAENLEECVKKYSLDLEEYKKALVEIMSDIKIDPLLSELRMYHYLYKNKAKKEQLYVFRDAEIWPIIKKRFLGISNNLEDVTEIELYAYLQQCIDHLEKDGKAILDVDCCAAYRRHIDVHPDYYVEHFVRQVMDSLDPEWNSIGCEPFWKQIFKDVENMKQYAQSCSEQGVKNGLRMCNFAELFVAHGCEPIEFQRNGIVQEKIDGDLKVEVDILHKLQEIDKKMNYALKRIKKPETLKKRVMELKQLVDENYIPVNYRADLIRRINDILA